MLEKRVNSSQNGLELFELSKRVKWVIGYWKVTFAGLDSVEVSLLALPLPFEVHDLINSCCEVLRGAVELFHGLGIGIVMLGHLQDCVVVHHVVSLCLFV